MRVENKRMCPVLGIVVIAVCGLLSLGIQQESSAQQIMLQANVNGNENLLEQLKKGLAEQKLRAENRLKNRIADINSACDLSPKQIKKLEVAAKGAVDASMKKARANAVQQAKSMGLDFDAEEEAKEEPEEAPAGVVAGNLNRVVINRIGFSQNQSGVESQKIWSASIKKVLNDEQWGQWEAWKADRKTFQTEMAVGNFIAEADRRLLLSREQREAMLAHVTEKYGEMLRSQAANRSSSAGVFVLNRRINGEAAEESDPRFSELLSKSQLTIWQKEFANRIANKAQGNVVRGALNFNVGAVEIVETELIEEAEAEEGDDQ